MNPAFPSRLVRGWVAIYTRGLPAEVRAARIDEIESDLWCQHEEAGATGRSDSALALEILARLLLGLAADVTWRLDRGRLADQSIERTTTTGTKIIALLAVLGGLGLAIVVADWAATDLANPGAHSWEKRGWTSMALLGAASIVALSALLGGLGFILLYRFDSPIGMVAEIGAFGGVTSMLGAYRALAVLPAASAIVVLYLARIHVVHWWIAVIHVASAPGLAIGLAAYSNDALFGISVSLILVYCITWIAIGLELLRGLPVARPVALAT